MATLAGAVLLALQIRIDLSILLNRRTPVPPRRAYACAPVVAYRFVAPAGTRITYSGESFTVGEVGFLDLIADPEATTFSVDGRSYPLGEGLIDAFGFRHVVVSHHPHPTEVRHEPLPE